MEKEHMKLVIDGNAVYEIDQECMSRGMNREQEKEQTNVPYSRGRNYPSYPARRNHRQE
ncbi:MAG: hypothetical protein HFI75_14895 [Lachnospiraceae bacterium]|nr:hypothetical protein [Lachnospiraceae bacterium]